MTSPGWVVILNGAPRSGKSSIVAAMQEQSEAPWMNLGVDVHARHVTPPRFQPGIGLRPGNERPDLADLVPRFYAALYDSIAAHSRQGLDVVVDVGHHQPDAASSGVLNDCVRRLAGLPVLLVGVRCPIDEIMRRRHAGQPGREGQYAVGSAGEPVPAPVLRWQREAHIPGIYDLEVDTCVLSATQCAQLIAERLRSPLVRPTACERLAAL